MPAYEVRIVYRGQSTYLVTADTQEAAESAAMVRYERGENSDSTGSDWEEIDSLTVSPIPESDL